MLTQQARLEWFLRYRAENENPRRAELGLANTLALPQYLAANWNAAAKPPAPLAELPVNRIEPGLHVVALRSGINRAEDRGAAL